MAGLRDARSGRSVRELHPTGDGPMECSMETKWKDKMYRSLALWSKDSGKRVLYLTPAAKARRESRERRGEGGVIWLGTSHHTKSRRVEEHHPSFQPRSSRLRLAMLRPIRLPRLRNHSLDDVPCRLSITLLAVADVVDDTTKFAYCLLWALHPLLGYPQTCYLTTKPSKNDARYPNGLKHSPNST